MSEELRTISFVGTSGTVIVAGSVLFIRHLHTQLEELGLAICGTATREASTREDNVTVMTIGLSNLNTKQRRTQREKIERWFEAQRSSFMSKAWELRRSSEASTERVRALAVHSAVLPWD